MHVVAAFAALGLPYLMVPGRRAASGRRRPTVPARGRDPLRPRRPAGRRLGGQHALQGPGGRAATVGRPRGPAQRQRQHPWCCGRGRSCSPTQPTATAVVGALTASASSRGRTGRAAVVQGTAGGAGSIRRRGRARPRRRRGPLRGRDDGRNPTRSPDATPVVLAGRFGRRRPAGPRSWSTPRTARRVDGGPAALFRERGRGRDREWSTCSTARFRRRSPSSPDRAMSTAGRCSPARASRSSPPSPAISRPKDAMLAAFARHD